VWRFSNKEKFTILRYVIRIFEIFGGGKRTPDHQSIKFYLVNILYTHESNNFVLREFLLVSLYLGDIHFWPKIVSLEV
jgi:hypothetical protein